MKKILSFIAAVSLISQIGFAANYDIREMTPEIKNALSGRQARYAELQAAKNTGAIRENNEGLVSGNFPLVSAENRDRMVIYRAIAEQNNLGSAGLPQIQRAFAETIREREGR
ncbi:MAG TPA: DUF1318 domain-containing protein [Candidatus Omnitrophota bacterium]|nr:hypothetical protein [Candidatus Omnitrophota bacterium]HRK62404.1 DUF1318 domain-containing protein [Candidatus Omnitrophota bacterium]